MRNYENMITLDEFIGTCKGWVSTHYNKYHKKEDEHDTPLKMSEVFTVWYSTTLGNHKCILATTRDNYNLMIECTYDKSCAKIYFDVYDKEDNVALEL